MERPGRPSSTAWYFLRGGGNRQGAADKTDVSRTSNVVPLTCFTPPHAVNGHASSITAMYPNNDTLGERLRLYVVEENFHVA
jgi:hypothetical protein